MYGQPNVDPWGAFQGCDAKQRIVFDGSCFAVTQFYLRHSKIKQSFCWANGAFEKCFFRTEPLLGS